MLNEQYIQRVVKKVTQMLLNIQSRRYKYFCGECATQNHLFNDLWNVAVINCVFFQETDTKLLNGTLITFEGSEITKRFKDPIKLAALNLMYWHNLLRMWDRIQKRISRLNLERIALFSQNLKSSSFTDTVL